MKKKIIILVCIIIVTKIISTYWYQVLLVQGQSMSPTYKSWEMVMIEKRFDELYQDDVIAFYSKGVNAILIKRIVAAPGDTVLIVNGNIYINDELLKEDYYINLEYAGSAEQALHLEKDEYFVLGDNYEVSKDSRYKEIGCVKVDSILGKVVLPRRELLGKPR